MIDTVVCSESYRGTKCSSIEPLELPELHPIRPNDVLTISLSPNPLFLPLDASSLSLPYPSIYDAIFHRVKRDKHFLADVARG